MFLLSYQFFVIFFSICYSIFFFFKLHNPTPLKVSCDSQRSEILYISAMLILLVLPWIVYAALNPQSFRSADIFSYMTDSQKILRQGNIPQPSLMLENQYYASFPVFTLLISLLTGVSGLTSLQGVYIVDIAIQALFWLSIWILLSKSLNSKLKFQYIFLGIVIAAYANPYLYGYFNTPLPQIMGLCVLLLLFIMSMPNSKSYSVIYVILLVIGLVQVSIIPIFLLVLVAMLLLNAISAKQHSQDIKIKNSLSRMLLPAIIFLTYLFYTIAVYPVTDYLRKIFSFMTNLAKDASSGQIAVTAGLSRGALYPLNALGPALVIGATLAFLILYFRAIRKHDESNNWVGNNWLGAIAVLALLFIAIGTLRGQFNVWGTAFFSISRYFNLPGYTLATIVANLRYSQHI